MFGGYGNGTGAGAFNMQDYAPINPLTAVPGYGFPQGPQPNASQQRQPPAPSANSAPGSSQTAAVRPANVGARNLSTEELRRDLERAAPYVPTPINGTSTGPANSAPQPSRPAHNQQRSSQQTSNPAQVVPQQQTKSTRRGQASSASGSRPANNNGQRPNGSNVSGEPGRVPLSPQQQRHMQHVQNGNLNNIAQQAPHMNAPRPQIQGQQNGLLINTNPDIHVFPGVDPRSNTHAVYNSMLCPMSDLADLIVRHKMVLNSQAVDFIRQRVHPNHPVQQHFDRIIQAQIQNNAMPGMQPNGNPQQQRVAPARNGAPRMPNNVPNAPPSMMPLFHPPFPPGVMPPPQLSPQQFFQQQQFQHMQMNPSQMTQQQHMQHVMAMHHRQQQQNQQQFSQQQQRSQNQAIMPPPQLPHRRNPQHSSQPETNAQNQPSTSMLPPRQIPKETRTGPAQSTVNPTVPGSTPPPTIRMSGSGNRTVAADEAPPYNPYTPHPQLSSAIRDPEETIDVKPAIVPQKKNKTKKPIETITIEDEEPRRVIVKNEIPEAEVSSSSDAVSGTPSTASAPVVNTSVKKEPTDVSSDNNADSTKETSPQQTSEVNQAPAAAIQEPRQNADQESIARLHETIAEMRRELAAKDEKSEKERIEARAQELAIPMAEKLYQERIAREAAEKAQRMRAATVQVSQSSTSETRTIKPPISRTPSPVTRQRKNAVVEESDDDEDDDEEEEKSDSRVRKNRSDLKRKKRQVICDDSDDDMPIIRKRQRGILKSSDDEENDKEWEGSNASESEESDYDPSTVQSEFEEEEEEKSFIASDDEEIFEDEEDELEVAERKLAESRRNRRKKEEHAKSRRREASPPKQSRTERRSVERNRRQSSEPGPSTRSKPMTEEEQKKARRLKTMQTKEANRERKRMEKLDQVKNMDVRRTRHNENGDPLGNTLDYTIMEYNKLHTKRNSEDSSRRQSEKIQPTSTHKRPTQSGSEDTDDDGTHIPAKRKAHSNSVPDTSKVRPAAISSRNRPNQNDMLQKRHIEGEEKKKREQAEYDKLSKKKYPTREEEMYIQQLKKSLGIGRAPGSVMRTPSSSTPSTSSAFNKKLIKKEIISSPVKKLPSPDPLEGFKGRSFLKQRKHVVGQIFNLLSDQNKPDAAEQAQKIELAIVEAHPKAEKYSIAATHKLAQMRKQSTSGIIEINKNAVSHEQILAGGPKENCTVGINRKVHVQHRQLPIEQLHKLIEPLKLTAEELEREAYPLFKSNSKNVTIAQTQYTANKKVFLKDYDLTRTCSRCNKEFSLRPDGTMIREKDICRYHNRGIAREGKRDTFRKTYPCCNEEYNVAPGCKFSDVHVFDQLFERELGKFVSTPPPTGPNDPRTVKAYAIDCEMVYTVAGPALARLSMVDMYGNKVLDVFIKPPTEVLDPNTEFSGLTMDDIKNAKDTMQTCHQKLFKLVNSETILIGHSLESDLKAMRIVHKSVIDTAVLFKSTGDFKIALRNLSSKLLRKTIQGDNEDAVGHDSLEDARTCVDLIYYGLKNPESVVIRR